MKLPFSRTSRRATLLAILFPVFGNLCPCAAGPLGTHHLAASLDYVDWDHPILPRGWGATLTYNQPLTAAVDWSLSYSHVRTDFRILAEHIHADGVELSGRWFTGPDERQVYIRIGAGWTTDHRSRVVMIPAPNVLTRDMAALLPGGDGDFRGSDLTFARIETGLQLEIGPRTTITPSASYWQAVDSDDEDRWEIGLRTDFLVNQRWGLLLACGLDDETNLQFSVGALTRF